MEELMKQSARSGLRWSVLILAFICVAAIFTPLRRIASSIRHAFDTPPVFANGTEGYHCFRIPAIVQTPDGTLLAFAEARKNDCDDFGDIRIVMRSSHDEGKSWSALQTVASNGNLQAGNPVPVVDTMDPRYPHGRVFLIYTTADAPELAVQEGHGTVRVWYRASTDDGATWTPPVEITTSAKLASWRDYAGGSGHGLQLTEGAHKGRIFIPAYHSEGAPQQGARDVEAHSFFSDDHGQTWTLGATVAWPGSNESSAAQAGDGSIVMNSRDESGVSHARIVSVSKSGGEHWDETFVAHDLPDPACEGSMVSYEGPDHKPVLLFSNLLNTNTGHREGLTVSESTDGGRRWRRHTVIYKGPSAYSDLVVMQGRELGILWERGNDGIVFANRPIDHLF
jgi:sialidase-1